MVLTPALVAYQDASLDGRYFTRFLQGALCEAEPGFPDAIAQQAAKIYHRLSQVLPWEEWFDLFRDTIHQMVSRDQTINHLLEEKAEKCESLDELPQWDLSMKRQMARDAAKAAGEAEEHYRKRSQELHLIRKNYLALGDFQDVQSSLLMLKAMQQDTLSKMVHCQIMVDHFLERMGGNGHPEIFEQAKYACTLSLESVKSYVQELDAFMDEVESRKFQVDFR